MVEGGIETTASSDKLETVLSRSYESPKELDDIDVLDNSDEKQASSVKPVSIPSLFQFATKLDIMLNLAGFLFSCATGAVMPVMTYVLSGMLSVVARYETQLSKENLDEANHYLDSKIRYYCLWIFILGIIMWVLAFCLNACWAIAAENQGLRVRKLYYESIMRQNVGWFDTIKTGELTTRITNDVNLFQDGIGEKFGFVFMNIAGFITALVIAFVKGWKLAFICLCVVPFIIAAGGLLEAGVSRMFIFVQERTAAAGAIVEEAVSGIRTVMAFNGQAREIKRYDDIINESYRQSVK
ncbi:hypothetical protein IWW36_005650, partial [Coemansia brasiliensis]